MVFRILSTLIENASVTDIFTSHLSQLNVTSSKDANQYISISRIVLYFA